MPAFHANRIIACKTYIFILCILTENHAQRVNPVNNACPISRFQPVNQGFALTWCGWHGDCIHLSLMAATCPRFYLLETC